MSKIDPDDAPKDAAIKRSSAGRPDDSDQPIGVTEGEAFRIRAKLDRSDDEECKDDVRETAAQLARPKHGTA